jgi:hypothetical protein
MLKGWADKLFVLCLTITAAVEAGQQALKDAPALTAKLPNAVRGGFWNYVPLAFLIAAAVIALIGRLLPSSRSQARVDWRGAFRTRTPKFELIYDHTYVNQTIEVDGKSFRNCSFSNVTFLFRGTAPFEFVDGNRFIEGGFSFSTDDPAVMLFSKMQRFSRSIPGAQIKEGGLDEKGNLLADRFEITKIERPHATPAEALAAAEEAMFVDELLEMSIADVRVNLANDLDFRQKYYDVPNGRYPQLDQLKAAIDAEPLIAAKFLRAHLMPRSPWADMVKDIFRAAGRTSYEAESDFLLEIHAVNVSLNPTTLQDVVAEAEVGGKWVSLKKLLDLSMYEIVFDPMKETDSPFVRDFKTEKLDSFWDRVSGKALTRGVGYKGWVGFELVTDSTNLEKAVNHRVRLIDALGNIHPVVMLKGHVPDTDWRLRHSPKASD